MSDSSAKCDTVNCPYEESEIRLLPTGGGGNSLVCKHCYLNEILFRKSRNLDISTIPNWTDLKIYDPGS